jgi:hypothetical protein
MPSFYFYELTAQFGSIRVLKMILYIPRILFFAATLHPNLSYPKQMMMTAISMVVLAVCAYFGRQMLSLSKLAL